MDEEKTQKELFEFEQPKRRFAGFAGIFRKAGIENPAFAVTLKADKIVFISIAVIMMMVIVYALGVERGRSLSQKLSQAPAVHSAPVVKAVTEIKPVASIAQVPAAMTAKDLSKPYTIAVASLSKKETAQAEAARMKNIGFDSFVIYSSPYYVVCIGAFADKTGTASQKELARVKRFSRDAYFRTR